jgi:hypothetical protein
MQAPSGNQRITTPSLRVRELVLALPTPPAPLDDYVESSDAGNLLFPNQYEVHLTLPPMNRPSCDSEIYSSPYLWAG